MRLQAMFPNCSRKACNDYPTCSGTQAFCNETAEGVSTWDLCINGLSKSVSRTEATEDLSLHTNHMKPGARETGPRQVSMVTCGMQWRIPRQGPGLMATLTCKWLTAT